MNRRERRKAAKIAQQNGMEEALRLVDAILAPVETLPRMGGALMLFAAVMPFFAGLPIKQREPLCNAVCEAMSLLAKARTEVEIVHALDIGDLLRVGMSPLVEP